MRTQSRASLRNQLLALYKRFAFNKRPQQSLTDALLASYEEPQRRYHNLTHIQECLQLHSVVLPHCQAPDEVALAIWYHDAIYDPKAKDNEEQSAARARAELSTLRGNDASVERIAQMVLATKHHKAATPDEQILMDIDLSILAAAPERFEAYCREIRAEYAHVPWWAYVTARRRVLKGFLAQPQLFRTQALAHHNALATANLKRSTGLVRSLLA